MKLAQDVKTIGAINNKKNRRVEHDNRHAILESRQHADRIAHEKGKRHRVWGGYKTQEMPRERRDFEVDIARPLGPTYFRRAYCMKKESFYRLYSILKKELTTEFIK